MQRSRLALLAFAALPLFAGCPQPDAPKYPVRDCQSVLTFAPQASVSGVSVEGEWNGFAPQPLTRGDDGAFRISLALSPRDYAYRLNVDGTPENDPANPYTRWVGNVEYSRLNVGACEVPQLRLDAFHYDVATRGVTVQARYVDGKEARGPDLDTAVLALDGAKVDGAFDAQTGRFDFARSGLAHGKHTVTVSIRDQAGREAAALYLPFWVEDEPFDWQEAILYFAFTDRFRNGDASNDAPVDGVDPQANYLGGDFAGIRQAIEEGYFDKLGVRAIWISPVVANPDAAYGGKNAISYTGYHGYWPSAARETQRRFGSLDELRALTKAAHDRGIRVITDLVINHLSDAHPYYAQHKEDGWFNLGNACVCGDPGCDWEARRLDCWFTPYLPDLNWRSTQLADQMVGDALWWLKEADLDGFRLDAVKHVDHVAGRTLSGRLNELTRATGTEFYLVGETFSGTEGRPLINEYIGPQELDGQFNFPLYWPIVDAFARGQPLTLVDDAVAQDEAFYPPWAINSQFVGNHDVPRFISIAAGQIEADPGAQAWGNKPPPTVDQDLPFLRAKQALTFALTLPGVPLLYYGDEVGLPGTGDPDNRRMMKWGAQLSAREADLLAHVQRVGQARRTNHGLRYGARYTLDAEADLLVYQRDDSAGTDGAVIALWRGTTERQQTAVLRGRLKTAEGMTLKDVVSGRTATIVGGQVTLPLAPGSASVWVPTGP